jgi:class 3 adenylate cyclase
VADLAGGSPTFLFTDVEGSTRLLRQLRDDYGAVLAEHQRLLREAISSHGGHEVDMHGDSLFAAFRRPRDAVLAAVAAQAALARHSWPEGAALRVRMGVHTGPAEVAEGRYVGLAVHRAARLCSAGHGGQVLVSHASVALLEDEEADLPEIELQDLGTHLLKDFDRPVGVYQVVAPGLEAGSPPLRTERHAGNADLALRASDADRDRTVVALREHAAAGRLTLEEFSERVEKATSALTLGELEEVARDLPAEPVARHERRAKRFTGVLFSDTERTGRWRLPRFSLAVVVFGNADLDLRQAELHGDAVSLTAFVLFGNIDVYVPEGVELDLGGLSVFGHLREHGREVPPAKGTPLVQVRIFSFVGTADAWRVPRRWAELTFSEVFRAFRRGDRPELPPGG